MAKLLLTLAAIVAVWYLFKSQKRVNQSNLGKWGRAFGAARKAMTDSAKAREAGEPATDPPKSGSQPPVDLRPCPKCGAYVAVGTTCSCQKV